MVEDDERLAGTPAARTRLMQADWPHRLAVSPPVHGWGTFHLIVANRSSQQGSCPRCDGHHKMFDLGVASEPVHSATRYPQPVWPQGDDCFDGEDNEREESHRENT